MDFSLTEEQKMFQTMVRDFAAKEVEPVAAHFDETEEFPWEIFRKMAELGLTGVTIAERRRPDPRGRPGFLRVDTVHQGDWDDAKGVYHLRASPESDAILTAHSIGKQYIEAKCLGNSSI